jgi:hypothetical protein
VLEYGRINLTVSKWTLASGDHFGGLYLCDSIPL